MVRRAEVSEKVDEELQSVEKLSDISCKACGKIYKSKRGLRKHIVECHPIKIKCKKCEAFFYKKSDLEKHLEAFHDEKRNHTCEQFDKTFVMQWRLNKHVESHAEGTKFCHFFNFGKTCHYEDIGWMFLHKNSERCYFGDKCNNKLCQFTHSEEINHDDMEAGLNAEFDKLTEKEKN